MFSKDTLQKYIDEGKITGRRHPEFPYTIYNYTPLVQFKRLWDEVTLACRGLILDDEGNIIARPFPKFFNYEELVGTELGKMYPIPTDCGYSIYSKLDGSLGIMYQGPDVVFDDGFRMKMKYEEYVKLHRVISSFNNDKYIWECLKGGVDIEDMIKDIPDEFYQDIQDKVNDFKTKYNLVYEYCASKFMRMAMIAFDEPKMGVRKNQALWFKENVDNKYLSIMFKMLDGKPYEELIWKAIKPNDSK